MVEHLSEEHSEHLYRRRERDRGYNRSRSPRRRNHPRERDGDGHGHRDRKRSRSRSPRRHRYSDGYPQDRADHRTREKSVKPSQGRARSTTPRGHCSSSPYSSGSSPSTDSRHPAKHNCHNPSSGSHSYERSRNCHRSRSRSHSQDRERRKSKLKEKDCDRRRRHKDKERKRDKDEKRSVLTGKKIKLKVHKDSRDLEMDANREDLLQFLNSTFG